MGYFLAGSTSILFVSRRSLSYWERIVGVWERKQRDQQRGFYSRSAQWPEWTLFKGDEASGASGGLEVGQNPNIYSPPGFTVGHMPRSVGSPCPCGERGLPFRGFEGEKIGKPLVMEKCQGKAIGVEFSA